MFDNYRVFHGEFNTNDVLYERPKETCYILSFSVSLYVYFLKRQNHANAQERVINSNKMTDE